MRMFWWMTATAIHATNPPKQYTVHGVSDGSTEEIWEEAMAAFQEVEKEDDVYRTPYRVVVNDFEVLSNRGG